MSETLLGLEGSLGGFIQKDRISNSLDTVHDTRYLTIIKIHLLHHSFDEISLYFIIGFAHVELHGHSSRLARSLSFDSVDALEAKNNVIRNEPPGNKGRLVGEIMLSRTTMR